MINDFYSHQCKNKDKDSAFYICQHIDDIYSIEDTLAYCSEMCGYGNTCKQFVDLTIKYGKLLEKRLSEVKKNNEQ